MLTRKLTILLLRLPFLVAPVLWVAQALVAVPENRAARTVFLTSKENANNGNNRLFLENSPLIGGPSWLPLHVKVILEDDDDRVAHRWDFVPINATSFATLRKLLMLRAVPAEIRYQSAPLSATTTKINPVDGGIAPTGFGIVLMERTANNNDEDGATSSMERNGATDRIVERANGFCESYPEELHLIQNNCWRFAFELYDHLAVRIEYEDCYEPNESPGVGK